MTDKAAKKESTPIVSEKRWSDDEGEEQWVVSSEVGHGTPFSRARTQVQMKDSGHNCIEGRDTDWTEVQAARTREKAQRARERRHCLVERESEKEGKSRPDCNPSLMVIAQKEWKSRKTYWTSCSADWGAWY